jgi:hypothetical protein
MNLLYMREPSNPIELTTTSSLGMRAFVGRSSQLERTISFDIAKRWVAMNQNCREFGQVLFAVPDSLSDHRIRDDEYRYTRLLNEHIVTPQDHCDFKAVMTSCVVRDWLSDASQGLRGCAIKILSASFGRETVANCGACPFCRTIPLTNLQTEATHRIRHAGQNESTARRVLTQLTTACLVCGNPSCRGIPLLRGTGSKTLPENKDVCFQWKMCYACGVSTHDRKLCPLKKIT